MCAWIIPSPMYTYDSNFQLLICTSITHENSPIFPGRAQLGFSRFPTATIHSSPVQRCITPVCRKKNAQPYRLSVGKLLFLSVLLILDGAKEFPFATRNVSTWALLSYASRSPRVPFRHFPTGETYWEHFVSQENVWNSRASNARPDDISEVAIIYQNQNWWFPVFFGRDGIASFFFPLKLYFIWMTINFLLN